MSEVIEVTRERQVENHKMLIELCKPWNPEHAAKEIERRFDGAKPAAAKPDATVDEGEGA